MCRTSFGIGDVPAAAADDSSACGGVLAGASLRSAVAACAAGSSRACVAALAAISVVAVRVVVVVASVVTVVAAGVAARVRDGLVVRRTHSIVGVLRAAVDVVVVVGVKVGCRSRSGTGVVKQL